MPLIPPFAPPAFLAAAALGLASATGPDLMSRRCSLVPGFHNSGDVMIAVATADTVVAGPGSLRLGKGGGHSGRGERATIYGQRFRALRLHVRDRDAITDSVQDVVMVPWDYDAACDPVPWARSARWMGTSDTMLLSARLRDRANWASGLPTFDVIYPSTAVYAGGPQPTPWGDLDSTSTWNTPMEYFELIRRVPPRARLLAEEERALEPFVEWASENPQLMAKKPASTYLPSLRRHVRENRLYRREVPVRGTYELTIRLRSGRTFVRYLQTSDAPLNVKDFGKVTDGPNGIELSFNMAGTRDALPSEISQEFGMWGMRLVVPGTSGASRWPFQMNLEELTYYTRHIPELNALKSEWYSEGRPGRKNGYLEEGWGQITLEADGSARLYLGWDTNGDGRDDVRMEGKRISMATATQWLYWRDR